MSEPLLQDKWQRAAAAGLKATGPWIFVPRNSWRLGWFFIALSGGILVLTVVTSILHNV